MDPPDQIVGPVSGFSLSSLLYNNSHNLQINYTPTSSRFFYLVFSLLLHLPFSLSGTQLHFFFFQLTVTFLYFLFLYSFCSFFFTFFCFFSFQCACNINSVLLGFTVLEFLLLCLIHAEMGFSCFLIYLIQFTISADCLLIWVVELLKWGNLQSL